ncbi:MAG: SusC/RagA family TonB-linked outer membrane protein [Candidatus Cryptobacteroides sp.]
MKSERKFFRCLFLAAFLSLPVLLQAQTRTIRGGVSDENGPLIGVSVVLDSAGNIGTSTDVDGNFSLTVNTPNPVLRFTYVGYKEMVVKVGASDILNVTMEQDTNLLEELVVVGYGTQSKSHLTGSISKIGGESLIDMPVSDVTQALQGQIAGLTVNNTTSEVGVAPTIRVRGTGSISADSSPLVIVDGFPVPDGLSSVNANDIKSIEILKDAASAAIYGSRAANGVIMITTKAGDAEKPSYSVKVYQGIKYAYKLHDLLTATEYLRLQEFEESVGGPAVKGQDRAAAWIEENIGATDWQREALRNYTDMTNVQFSVSGGSAKARHYTSASWTQDKGIMYQNQVNKISFRTRLDAELSRIVKIGYNVSFNYSKSSRPRNNFIDFYRTPSFLPVYHNDWTTAFTGGYTGFARGSHFNKISTPTGGVDEDGNPTWDTGVSPFNSANNNPKSVMANTERWSESMSGLANAYLVINICKGLTFKTSDGFNVRYSPSYNYANKNATKDNLPSEASFFSTLYMNLLSENTLNYNATFGKHKLDLLAGYTIERTRVQRVALSATGFPTDDIHTLNAATVFELASSNNGNTDGTGTFRYPDEILESALARATYSYADKYLVSASIRLDRSSLFSKGHRNAWFPSVSLGWRLSEEPWLKSAQWLGNLKLRASYGVTGNNNVGYQSSMELLNSANYATGSGNGSLVNGSANTSSTLANADITWEQTDEFNVGLDFSVLNGRIALTLDGYYSITRALLFEQPTQSFTGFTNYWNNIGRVRNSGVEIQLNTLNIDHRRFKWSTDINFSLSRNKLLEIGGEREVITLGERNESYIARVGEPLIQYYGFKTVGVWNNLEEINSNPHFASDVPGGLRISDENGDGVLDDSDRVPLGNPYPDFTYGMTNTFQIGKLDISFLIQGVQGITVYNGDVFYNETHKYNKAYLANRWVSDTYRGDGKTPYGKNGYDLMLTDYPLQNGSYVCLRNAVIGYTFSRKDLNNKLKGLRLYLSGNNLAYIWSKDYKGINPESRMTTGSYDTPMISGYQRGGFPLTSTVTFGIDIKF